MKRKHPTFAVPNFGAKKRKRVKERWRAQHGIDNKKRIKRSGYGKMPSIGYKNKASDRHTRADGTIGILVHNSAELQNAISVKGVSIVLFHGLSSRKKAALQKIADEKGIKVTNKVKV